MDIYFNPEYGKLNEQIEKGKAETFDFTCEYGTVRNLYIKREVPYIVDGVRYFDAITPYGYGGPVIVECKDKEKLLEAYSEAYAEHCKAERIVDEFVRFHPLAENALDFGGIYEAEYNRHTLAVDLTDENYSAVQFSPDCRNMIRKAIKKGVTVKVDAECEHLDSFINLYYETLNKNEASDYYYFSKEYFETLKNIDGCKLILINGYVDGEIIASSVFMCSEEYMHYHLSATNPEFYSYAANNLILACAVEYGMEHGLKWLHLGGGLSGSEKDNLFRFKRSFGRTEKNLKDFYLGKAIIMPDVYGKLCELSKADGVENADFFPAYREAHW